MPMPAPVMYVVAGPPGGGKTSLFPVRDEGFDYFDADAKAAELNSSYRGIPQSIRAIVNREFEAFINRHIAEPKSFAFETTLRSSITFNQAQLAPAGFSLVMTYVALASLELHIERVAARADRGGHSASPGKLAQIHAASMSNLRRALVEFDHVDVYDNSGAAPYPVLLAKRGKIVFQHERCPLWAKNAARLQLS